MTSMTSRWTVAFVALLALFVVFAAVPSAEGQWVKLIHTNTTTFRMPPSADDYLELNVEVGGFRQDRAVYFTLNSVDGVTDEYSPGSHFRNTCSFRTRIVRDRDAAANGTVKMRISYSGLDWNRFSGGEATSFCRIHAYNSEDESADTPIYLLPPEPTLDIWEQQMVADPEMVQSLTVQTMGFFGEPYVELDRDRSHHLCGFTARSEHAVGLGIPDDRANHYWEWDELRPRRITSNQIAPGSYVECVFSASGTYETTYDTVNFIAVDDGGDPPEPPVVDNANRRAMMAFYNGTFGDRWHNNTHWGTDRPLSDWYGVTTDGAGRVTGLRLPDNNLSGRIPRELGDLPNLETLVLTGNNLEGSIPESLRKFENTINPQRGGRNLPVGPTPPPPGDLSITLSAADTTLTEGESTRLIATANRAVAEDVRIQVQRIDGAGTADRNDVRISSLDIVIRSGQTDGSITLTAVSDDLAEGTETEILIGVWGDNNSEETNRLTITIRDGAAPPPPPGDLEITLSEYNDNYNIVEGGDSATLYATANRIVAEDVTITLHRVGGSASRGDVDGLEGAAEAITIESGYDSGYGGFVAIEDGIYEAQETLTIEGRFDGQTTNRLTFTIWDVGVPALPFLGALLLAAGLGVMGLRKMHRR